MGDGGTMIGLIKRYINYGSLTSPTVMTLPRMCTDGWLLEF